MRTRTGSEASVNFRELRKNLSDYLRQACQGAEIIVTSRGAEVARIVPPAPKPIDRRRLVGMFKGQFSMLSDLQETSADVIAAMEGADG